MDAIIYLVGLVVIVMAILSSSACADQAEADTIVTEAGLHGSPAWSRISAVTLNFLSERFSLAHSVVARRGVPSISRRQVSSGEFA